MIHQYKLNGLNIVIDVNSGAIHVVDELVYDILNGCKPNGDLKATAKTLSDKYSVESVEEAVEEINGLMQQGLLYSKDVYEEIAEGLKRKPVVKALCMHAAHDCNLKCAYCFAGEGEYHGHSGRSLMSLEIGKRAIDYVIEASRDRNNIEIDFFGGEPTLNFDVVKEIVEYGKQQEKLHGKTLRFTLTTNGLLLNDEMQDYINENMKNVVLSIDGRKEVNDRMRYRADKSGSYDSIAPKFQKLAESRNQENYYVRGTFTKENLDFYEDVMHLQELGFKQISIEPVVADKDKPYALTEDDLPVIFEQYEKLAVELTKRRDTENNFNFFHFMIDLTGGPCAAKRISGCGAGTEYLAVTPEGELYPCHQFVGIEDFKMGNVVTGVTNLELYEKFRNSNVYTKEECRNCFAKFYCSGGCFASAYFDTGSINKPYKIGCELQRKRTECAIMIKCVQD